jgi:hypothetical protein
MQWTIPDGAVFLLGDHVSSHDSRHVGPIPRRDVIGRYVPILGWGSRPGTPRLDPADRDDVAFVLASGAPAAAALRRVLAVDGWPRWALAVVLRWAFVQLGDTARETALLERTLAREPDRDSRALWAALLATRQVLDGGSEAALATIDGVLCGIGTPQAARLATLRANALARLGWWEAALGAVAEAERLDPSDFHGARLAALIGLGRTAEAEAIVEERTRADAWGGACWAPYFRAYLACARGDVDLAAEELLASIAAGFPDRGLVRTAKLLEPLRRSDRWPAVLAALDAPR